MPRLAVLYFISGDNGRRLKVTEQGSDIIAVIPWGVGSGVSAQLAHESSGPLWGEARASQRKEPYSQASLLAENGLNFGYVCVCVCVSKRE